MYTIIKNCSPYYIEFGFENSQQVAKDICDMTMNLYQVDFQSETIHGINLFRLEPDIIDYLKDHVPFWSQFNLSTSRIIFTEPGGWFPIHIDNYREHGGINLVIKSDDGLSKTHWYNKKILEDYQTMGWIDYADGKPAPGQKSEKGPAGGLSPWLIKLPPDQWPAPEFSEVFHTGSFILFNAGIFHSWENINSKDSRIAIAFRGLNQGSTFEGMRQQLFGF